ncbi:MAG: hypothetical protein FJ303_22040 [Planctomycetes bacterium]|nr:hypothetical protein [Planctomycetota bacterium]
MMVSFLGCQSAESGGEKQDQVSGASHVASVSRPSCPSNATLLVQNFILQNCSLDTETAVALANACEWPGLPAENVADVFIFFLHAIDTYRLAVFIDSSAYFFHLLSIRLRIFSDHAAATKIALVGDGKSFLVIPGRKMARPIVTK